jgi:Ca2+-binding RTX toxin-like protein
VIRNSVITGNIAEIYSGGESDSSATGGGISVGATSSLDIANSIVVGNAVRAQSGSAYGAEIFGTITSSDGHNIFGFDVPASPAGDRVDIFTGSVFAAIDPTTGGGLLNASGIVPLRSSLDNPALSGADLLAAGISDQLGSGRPLPAGSLPDIGPAEINRAPSTTASPNNDVITDSSAGHTINAGDGADYVKGMGGNDTLHGDNGGDLLDGGTGNDKLFGDAGIDLVYYGGAAKVTVDLSLATDKAIRGSEIDTLSGIEGAVGSSAADTFKGDAINNYFQGGGGKDTATGGIGRDLYDFNAVADSKAGSTTRDLIKDFAHGTDKIDLMGLDADTTVAGNQAFHWVGKDVLTGPGEVGYFTTGGDTTIIRASNDGDAVSEFEIQLTGLKTLAALDFYL